MEKVLVDGRQLGCQHVVKQIDDLGVALHTGHGSHFKGGKQPNIAYSPQKKQKPGVLTKTDRRSVSS